MRASRPECQERFLSIFLVSLPWTKVRALPELANLLPRRWMFRLEHVEGLEGSTSWDIKLMMTPEAQERVLAAALPPICLVYGTLLLLRGVEHVWRAALLQDPSSRKLSVLAIPRRAGRTLWAFAVLVATSCVFLLSCMQLLMLHQPLLQPVQQWPPAVELYHAAAPFRISSG